MRTASHCAPEVVLSQHDADELADFACHGPAGSGDPGYVRWLIDRLGTHSVALTRQPHSLTPRLEAAPHLPAGRP